VAQGTGLILAAAVRHGRNGSTRGPPTGGSFVLHPHDERFHQQVHLRVMPNLPHRS
jgi:hypothetical protein